MDQREKGLIDRSTLNEFNKDLDFTDHNLFGNNSIRTEQDYEVTILQIQKYLLVTHSIKILMADSFLSHLRTSYWMASVEMNAPQTQLQ